MILRTVAVILLLWAAWQIQDLVPRYKTSKMYLSPPPQIKFFTLGYNDLLASSLWVRLLQDIDHCEAGKFTADDFVLPTINPDKTAGVLERQLKPSKCHLGWVYQMLHTISEVQPRFKLVYEPGATFLSLLVDDREGARLIFEKGLTAYPNDWMLNFKAGYHYLWEIQDASRAAQLIDHASKNGAPPIVVALAAALYTHSGQVSLAQMILQEALAQKPTGLAAERIKARLAQVNKILQEKQK